MKRRLTVFLAMSGFMLVLASCSTKPADSTSLSAADSLKIDSARRAAAADTAQHASVAKDTAVAK